MFDAIRAEIDPLPQSEEIDQRFESGIESVDVPQELNCWSSESYVVAHTGFEPVVPPCEGGVMDPLDECAEVVGIGKIACCNFPVKRA